MFFVRQRGNKCGLLAIQNMLQSAALAEKDMCLARDAVLEETGDSVANHESGGGFWSISVIVKVLLQNGYTVEQGVRTLDGKREWTSRPLQELLQDKLFRGVILHQRENHHYACLRPQSGDLMYVDSQADGPIGIGSKLAARRCLAEAYAWEPFIVFGQPMKYVAPVELGEIVRHQASRPSEQFMAEWNQFKEQKESSN